MNGASFLHAHTWLVSGKLNVTVTMVSRKIKVKLWYGCDLLGLGTLKSVLSQLKNKSINWADFLHDGSDGIIFS